MNYLFRPSSIGRLMTEPKTKSEGPLSVGARTYIRELVAQELFGVQFEVSSKYMEKGLRCEQESIDLLNHVRGLSLVKNTERRNDEYLTGECDLFDGSTRIGYDLKTSWSLATFPISVDGCVDKLYEWQMRAYMRLWNAESWSVDYCMVDTPEDLMRYEPMPLHIVSHIPPEHRITSWVITRDMEKEAAMVSKIIAARVYFAEVVAEFDRTHAIRFPEVKPLEYVAPAQDIFNTDEAAILADFAERFQLINAAADSEEAKKNTTAQDSQQVLKAEPAMADATDRDPLATTSPGVGHMGIGKAADTAPSDDTPMRKLGQICGRLGFIVKAEFLFELGFEPCKIDKAASCTKRGCSR